MRFHWSAFMAASFAAAGYLKAAGAVDRPGMHLYLVLGLLAWRLIYSDGRGG